MFVPKISNPQKESLAARNQPTFASIVAATISIVKQLFAMNALEKKQLEAIDEDSNKKQRCRQTRSRTH